MVECVTMKQYLYNRHNGLTLTDDATGTVLSRNTTTDEVELTDLDGVTVRLEHKVFGTVWIHNVTEVHINYQRGKLAIESDIDCTGETHFINDVIHMSWWIL